MSELRKDPIVNRWVIVAPERARRPEMLVEHARHAPVAICPFCPNQEAHTPPELLARRAAGSQRNGPGWTLRVFPNKFPALRVEGDLSPEGHGLYDRMNGIGAHEVFVECAEHERSLADLSNLEVEGLLSAYRDRVLDLRRDGRLRCVMLFKNHGAAAGATLAHSHSQLIALPTSPKNVADEMKGARRYYRYKERCVFCDILRQELDEKTRIVHENNSFVVIAPYASRSPFETWIVPRRHRACFESCERSDLADLADALSLTLRKLRRALDDPSYNYMFHSAPFADESSRYYHWHIEVMPTLSKVAGFEWGSGFHINTTPPEDAARYLRELPPE